MQFNKNQTLTIMECVNSQDSAGQIFSVWQQSVADVPCKVSFAAKGTVIDNQLFDANKQVLTFYISDKYIYDVSGNKQIFYEGTSYSILEVKDYQKLAHKPFVEISTQVISLGGSSSTNPNASVDISQFVQKTQKVNGHQLVGDVNITPADLGLDNIVEDKTYSQAFSNVLELTVTHNLGKYPSVSIVDSAGDEVVGSIRHLTINSLVVEFSATFSGIIYCN